MTRLKYTVGITINLGNYQSARVDIGMEIDMIEGETHDGVMSYLEKYCDDRLTRKVKEVKEDNNVK